MQTRPHRLIELQWPEFGEATRPPEPPAAEFERRLALTRAAMGRRAWTHLVVYGDREHFANLAWLTLLDPRFEEMLLVLGPVSRPLLILGNECEGYLPFSPLYRAGGLRTERFPAFSLLNQPRDRSRTLREILASEGIGAGSQVGCAGWKYFDSTDDLPSAARDYVAAFAGPYFEVLAEWFTRLRIGTPGNDLHALVAEKLPFERFGIFLNPGHLIHLDEWLSSPIYRGSTVRLRSGMAMQVDVIPSSPIYGSTRIEDGVVLADLALLPSRWDRLQRHRYCYCSGA